jgi:hypothetical protein
MPTHDTDSRSKQIFNATIGPFRKRWMFYDLMSADGITGQYDNCLFSLHMPQKLGKRKKEDDKVKRMVSSVNGNHDVPGN